MKLWIAAWVGLSSGIACGGSPMTSLGFCQRLTQEVGSRLPPEAPVSSARKIVAAMVYRPTATYVPVEIHPVSFRATYLNAHDILNASLGLPDNSVLLRSLDELKYLPFAQSDLDAVFATDRIQPLTIERAVTVGAVALRNKVRLSFIWLGREPMPAVLWQMAQLTGGKAVDLGPEEQLCRGPQLF